MAMEGKTERHFKAKEENIRNVNNRSGRMSWMMMMHRTDKKHEE